MTRVLITVDTELSAALFQAGADADANHAASIECDGAGIGWQMDRLDAHGLTGVFFVDPMPALVYGPQVIARIVGAIVGRGHEVQLHIHTEWLAWAREQPVGARRGQNIGDFSLADQIALLTLARRLLIDAGAPPPLAFRAGNYGASDDTLRALAALGFVWDSSFNPAYRGAPCHISLDVDQVDPVAVLGLAELPVAAIYDLPGRVRHAQICALSATEIRAALAHAAAAGQPAFAVVTHSFEMRSRDRRRPNRAVMRRFEALCRAVAIDPRLTSSGFTTLDPAIATTSKGWRLPPNRLRTAARVVEQALATLACER